MIKHSLLNENKNSNLSLSSAQLWGRSSILKTTLLSRSPPPSYVVSLEICKTCQKFVNLEHPSRGSKYRYSLRSRVEKL